MSDTDIKMSDVFDLPVRRHYSVIVESDENQRHDTEAFDAAVHAINSHDALIEQNKALIEALEHIKKHQEIMAGEDEMILSTLAVYNIAVKALEKAK